jgi:hypothetical protein
MMCIIILCMCLIEDGWDGESVGSEALSLLSYTLRYVSPAESGRLCQLRFYTIKPE